MDQVYLARVETLMLQPQLLENAKNLKIVYTVLHLDILCSFGQCCGAESDDPTLAAQSFPLISSQIRPRN